MLRAPVSREKKECEVFGGHSREKRRNYNSDASNDFVESNLEGSGNALNDHVESLYACKHLGKK